MSEAFTATYEHVKKVMEEEMGIMQSLMAEGHYKLIDQRRKDYYHKLNDLACIGDCEMYVDFMDWIYENKGQDEAANISKFVFYGFISHYHDMLEQKNKEG